MPNSFLVQSLDVTNYRGLKSFHYDKLSRVNLIGGRNGVGKSTLIEAVFLLLDRRTALTLYRPSMWRGLPLVPAAMKRQLAAVFHGGLVDRTIRIEAMTRDGKERVEYSYGVRVPHRLVIPPQPSSESISASVAPASSSSGEADVITIESFKDGALDERLVIASAGQGFTQTAEIASPRTLSPGVLLNASNRYSNPDNAERFSHVVEADQRARLIKIMQVAAPDLGELEILHSIVHGRSKGGGPWLPTPLLGDGAHLLLSIALAIMISRGGVVCLDEFDTAIHYSALERVWQIICELAREYNCQIFATTHSRECIAAAVTGLSSVQQIDDLQYTRLDRVEKRVVGTTYVASELTTAVKDEWELR